MAQNGCNTSMITHNKGALSGIIIQLQFLSDSITYDGHAPTRGVRRLFHTKV